MARRRVHNKSRYGCDLCKKRRVKCDEKRPMCTACAVRDEECYYSQAPQQTLLQPRITSSARASRSTSPAPDLSAPPPPPSPDTTLRLDESKSSTRLRDLELMHFWYTRTCQSFTAALTDLCRDDVMRTGFEHEHVIDFTLALTALHIASESSQPAMKALYVDIALQYQSDAFPPFRTALSNITESNCNALFMSSLMSMACSFILPFLVSKEKQTGSPSTACVMSLYHFMDGIGSVVQIGRSWLVKDMLKYIATARETCHTDMIEKIALASNQLRSLNKTVNSTLPSLYETFDNSIGCLEVSFVTTKCFGMSWIHLSGEDFVQQLQREDPMALVILMYWGVFLCNMDRMWWAVFAGRRLVEEVYEMLKLHGDEWSEAREWARIELGLG